MQSLNNFARLNGTRCRMLAGLLSGLVLVGPALADSGAEHQSYQDRPIELGVSGSSIEHVLDNAFAYCYAGTLGSLVTNGSDFFILSNNHVLAKENNPDSTALPANGYIIIQQGLLDEGACTLSLGDPAHAVADLTNYVPIVFGKGRNLPENRVDAAVAKALSGSVHLNGAIKDIGPLTQSAPVTVTGGELVQKSGRTTGHTFGEVAATGVTIKVSYNSGTALFVNQIEVVGLCGTSFSDAGDSGSLVSTLPDGTGPRAAVGLLFAGGGSSTFANPIGTVLDELSGNFSMVSDGTGLVNDIEGNAEIPTCSGGGGSDGGGGGNPGKGKKPKFAGDPAGLDRAAEVAERNRDRLLAMEGARGYGIGSDEAGNAVIRLYVENARRRAGAIPAEIEGVPVQVVVTGPIKAY